MKIEFWIILLGFALSQTIVDQEADGFIIITKDNYQEIVNQEKIKLFYFHSLSDCSNCEKIRNTLSEMQVDNMKLGLPMFIINCNQYGEICRTRLNNRKAPAILVQIADKFVYYYGDYSKKSINEFLSKRFVDNKVKNFNKEFYSSELKRTEKDQQLIFIYRGSSNPFLQNLLIPLTQFEPEETYITCGEIRDCEGLFKQTTDDILLIKANRRSFLDSNHLRTFSDLYNLFYNFKNVFFIPFGIEFKKKVIEEMSPTVVLTIYEERSEQEEDIFRTTMQKFAKICFASIIRVSNLNSDQKLIFKEFKSEIGISFVPKLMILEADMDTMTLQKYFYSNADVRQDLLSQFIEDWFNRKLEPSKKSQALQPGQMNFGFEMLNYDTFISKVFIKGQESLVLVHRDPRKYPEDQIFVEQYKQLAKNQEFKSLKYFLIDGLENDLPVFVSKHPCFIIFTKDSWEHPLVFDKNDYKKLLEVIRKRRELVFTSASEENKPEETGNISGNFDDNEETEL